MGRLGGTGMARTSLGIGRDSGQVSENRRSASTNGTARKITPGHEGRDGDRHPDLLAAALDRLDQLAVHVAADRPRLVADQPPEVAGLPVQREHADQPAQGVDVGHLGPLAQRLDLGQALADPPRDPLEVAARTLPRPAPPGATAPRRASSPRPAACRAARPRPGSSRKIRRCQRADSAGQALLDQQERQHRPAQHEPQGHDAVTARRPRATTAPPTSPASDHASWRTRNAGDVERRVHPLEPDRQRLGHPEARGRPARRPSGPAARSPARTTRPTSRRPDAGRPRPRPRRAPRRSTSGRRRNQRSSLSRSVGPARTGPAPRGPPAAALIRGTPAARPAAPAGGRPTASTRRPRRCRPPPSPGRTAWRTRPGRCRCSCPPAPCRTAPAA